MSDITLHVAQKRTRRREQTCAKAFERASARFRYQRPGSTGATETLWRSRCKAALAVPAFGE